MAVNFGQYEGHRIISDAGSKSVNMLVDAYKTKKAEDERKAIREEDVAFREEQAAQNQAAQLTNQTGEIHTAVLGPDGKYTYEKGDKTYSRIQDEKEFDLRQQEFKDIQLQRAEEKTGYKHEYNADGKLVQSIDQDGNPMLTMARGDVLRQDSLLNKGWFDTDGDGVFDPDVDDSTFAYRDKLKTDKREASVMAATGYASKGNADMLNTSLMSDQEINDYLKESGLETLDKKGLDLFRAEVENSKTRKLAKMENDYRKTGKIDLKAYGDAVFALENEVLNDEDLQERLDTKTGKIDSSGKNKYGATKADISWAEGQTSGAMKNRGQSNSRFLVSGSGYGTGSIGGSQGGAGGKFYTSDYTALDGDTDFSFETQTKTVTKDDNMLLAAMKPHLESIAADKSVDDLHLVKQKNGNYWLYEDDPVFDDYVQIKMQGNKPMVKIGGSWIQVDGNIESIIGEYK
tara:strand:+ start:2467 stop:3843 length:1377 start_codon:yes stop_codon:yes gene_type:complete